MTFNVTIGASPFMSCASMNKGIWISFAACEARNRTTAIRSCVNRKKSGAEVVCSTHLFLQYLSRYQDEHRKSAYAMTIYEAVVSWRPDTKTQHYTPPMPLQDRTSPSPSEFTLALKRNHGPRTTYDKKVIILLLPAGAIL